MKPKFFETIMLPESVSATYKDGSLSISKNGKTISRMINLPGAKMKINDKEISVGYDKAGKKERAKIMTLVAHLKNIFAGLDESYVYELEVCNVHFPMTVKLEKNQLVINNFLGEKQKRVANILPNVDVEVKGNKIVVSSADLEAAGQTSANIEKTTRVTRRDRRVFQDGIFLISKPGVGQ